MQRRGGDNGLLLDYSVNLNEIRRTWQRGNGWTYDIRATLLEGQAQIGDDITISDPLTGKKTKSRIIAVINCADDPTQNSIVAGAFKLDSATQAAETAQVAYDAKVKADGSLQENERYSNIYINHSEGVVAENRAGTLRVVMNGDDCFAVQAKQSDGIWKTITSTEKWGVLTPRLTTPESKDSCYATVGETGNIKGVRIIEIRADGSEKEIISIGEMLYTGSTTTLQGPAIKASDLNIILEGTRGTSGSLRIRDKSGKIAYYDGSLAVSDSATEKRYYLHFESGLLKYIETDT